MTHGNDAAKLLRAKLFAANDEAAYFGYFQDVRTLIVGKQEQRVLAAGGKRTYAFDKEGAVVGQSVSTSADLYRHSIPRYVLDA